MCVMCVFTRTRLPGLWFAFTKKKLSMYDLIVLVCLLVCLFVCFTERHLVRCGSNVCASSERARRIVLQLFFSFLS